VTLYEPLEETFLGVLNAIIKAFCFWFFIIDPICVYILQSQFYFTKKVLGKYC